MSMSQIRIQKETVVLRQRDFEAARGREVEAVRAAEVVLVAAEAAKAEWEKALELQAPSKEVKGLAKAKNKAKNLLGQALRRAKLAHERVEETRESLKVAQSHLCRLQALDGERRMAQALEDTLGISPQRARQVATATPKRPAAKPGAKPARKSATTLPLPQPNLDIQGLANAWGAQAK